MENTLPIELDRETDGRWIAEIPTMPGVLAYGSTPQDAQTKALHLAHRVIADRQIDNGESSPSVEIGDARDSQIRVHDSRNELPDGTTETPRRRRNGR